MISKQLAVSLCLMLIPMSAVAQRSTAADERLTGDARGAIVEYFADLCGWRGEYCGFTIDGRRECAREFIMNFPISKETPGGKRNVLWVTLGHGSKVVSVSVTKDGACRNESSQVTGS